MRSEVSVRAEAGQEEEERLWTQHERHRQELEAEKIRLARLRDRLLKWQEEAQEALLQQQQQLQQEAQQREWGVEGVKGGWGGGGVCMSVGERMSGGAGVLCV